MFSAAAAIWERGDSMWWDEMRRNKVLLSVLAFCAFASFFIFSISRKAGIFMWCRNSVIFVQAILLALVLQALLLVLLLSQFSDVIRLYEQHREQMTLIVDEQGYSSAQGREAQEQPHAREHGTKR
jgi:predicted membrane protein